VKREVLKREKEEKVLISVVWNGEKLRREFFHGSHTFFWSSLSSEERSWNWKCPSLLKYHFYPFLNKTATEEEKVWAFVFY